MSYERFAYLYDELMRDAPYEQWVSFVKEKLKKYEIEGSSLLDLACGTGELSVRFAIEGFQVTGVDLSSDMLTVAQTKALNHGLKVPFYLQNMAELEGLGQFDVIGIFCDSLNYLSSEETVIQTFSKTFQHLKKDAIFIFDVHSVYKINQIFMDQTFTMNEDHLAYIWNSFPGEFPNSVEHELSFFVLDEQSGKYDRFDELHQQRTFSIEQYSNWLVEAGFEILEINADFETKAPNPESERIFFIARK
ncbi:methyltransferase domain-containing protein [Neobacillus sp. PS3-40]|uniref:class I SAM-dependent DNA methyltransferase n=1 Tax=Neobacillus sp. PS3-40 TaxID=3070679 RepID=UPI0027E09214|nr:methyltransferase domain-containing protein [Neobacillus sp. PS3-40]WML45376.1 methyltransferase domain-containing protein [Neobacillus sp. PS3-40]